MADFRILMYEDDESWKDSFEYNMSSKINGAGKQLRIRHKVDGDSISEDLLFVANLIMVDYDLVDLTGDMIIEEINGDPDYNRVPIIFYSGGESVEFLQEIANRLQRRISCCSKEGNQIEQIIMQLVSN